MYCTQTHTKFQFYLYYKKFFFISFVTGCSFSKKSKFLKCTHGKRLQNILLHLISTQLRHFRYNTDNLVEKSLRILSFSANYSDFNVRVLIVSCWVFLYCQDVHQVENYLSLLNYLFSSRSLVFLIAPVTYLVYEWIPNCLEF